MNPRSLNRLYTRSLTRHASRMLGGVHRPRPPDLLAIACRALERVVKIDKSLRPFMQDQTRIMQDWLWRQEVDATVRKVYSQPPLKGKILVNKR